MTVSVVIPVYNGRELLKNNLPALLKAKPEEIILVDDASTDGTADYLAAHFPQAKLIRHSKNLRFPQTVNDGVAAATSDVVILLNQDVTPQSDFIKPLSSHFSDPKIFAVTLNEQVHSYARAVLKNGFLEFTNGPKDSRPHPSFWANGGSSAIRRDLWNRFGGFDSVFSPGYYEDFDLGWRARNQGFEIVWEPRSHVTHATESTNRTAFDPVYLRRIKERNYLIAHWKNLSWSQLLVHKYFLTLRLFRHPGYVVPVIMALKHLPHIIKFRLTKHA